MGERYQPIENYGVIGDLNTVALVSMEGSIDFCCAPHFDSPTLFGRLLDANKGGYFCVSPQMNDMKQRQLYLPDTNVLLTRFMSEDGIAELTDCMPVSQTGPGRQIIRIIRAVKGNMTVHMRCSPRFNYGRTGHRFERIQDGKVIAMAPDDPVQPLMKLHSEFAMTVEDNVIAASFTLKAGESAHFYLVWGEYQEAAGPEDLNRLVEATLGFWRTWIGQSNYKGRWQETVNRSALLLKLLTCHNTGAVVAAPTFGLPEAIGGMRNWDYRYCWIRDSAFTVYAFIRLGFRQESINYFKWVKERFTAPGSDGKLHVMYRLEGIAELPEETLEGWEGYRKSAPVRIGNAASTQRQLDIYGELLDSVYLSDKYVQRLSHDGWTRLAHVVEKVCGHWREADQGIWEIRGEPRQFLHSRLMSWVAIDRALRIAHKNSLPAPAVHWSDTRAEIYDSIYQDFWNEELQSFVQYKGSRQVDASLLMMPMVRFIAPTDPRWLLTLKRIGDDLGSDALIKRYKAEEGSFEGLDNSQEGSFTMCSFWYIECLARAGELDKARLLFEKMLVYANHVGLYAEELSDSGAHLGNFPQAFTHMALISAAYALNLKLDKASPKAWWF